MNRRRAVYRGRGLYRGLLLAFLSITLTLLAVEVGLRIFAPQALLHDPDAFLPDEELGARLAPGFSDRVVTTEFSSTWVINEKGYRGPPASPRTAGPSTAAPGTAGLRIVALGDSFTFGYGVEEPQAWPRVLEETMNRTRGGAGPVDVVNLGVGGYGTWQEAIWLERNQAELRPDLVILGFYVGNDPEDNARTVPGAAPGAHDTQVRPATAPRGERLRRWLGSHLHLYSLVSTRADELLVRLGLRRLVYPFELEILKSDESDSTRAAWEATGRSLARLAEFCRRNGARLVVMLIPMKHQISDAVWARLARYHGADGGGFDRLRPQRIARTLCETERIETLDLTQGLSEAAARAGQDPRVFYWPRDQHFNVLGHRQAARLLAEYLARE